MNLQQSLQHIQNIASDPLRQAEVISELRNVSAAVSSLELQLLLAIHALELYANPDHWDTVSWDQGQLLRTARKRFLLDSQQSGCGNHFASATLESMAAIRKLG